MSNKLGKRKQRQLAEQNGLDTADIPTSKQSGKKARARRWREIEEEHLSPAALGRMFLHVTHEKHLYRGDQLKELGYVEGEFIDGVINEKGYEVREKIVDNKIYVFKHPVQMKLNYARGMRRAYERNGVEGVNEYVMRIAKAIQGLNEKDLSHE